LKNPRNPATVYPLQCKLKQVLFRFFHNHVYLLNALTENSSFKLPLFPNGELHSFQKLLLIF
jgi:hypothetical protein